MNFYIWENIFKILKPIDVLYCKLLFPELNEIKTNKTIYLNKQTFDKSTQRNNLLNFFNKFKNIYFDLIISKYQDLETNFSEIENLNITVELYDSNLIKKKDIDSYFQYEINIPRYNFKNINYIEIHIPSYFKIKNNFLEFENINSVTIQGSDISIEKVYLKNVRKIIINSGFSIKDFIFDDNLLDLTIYKINHLLLRSLKSYKLENLNISGSYFYHQNFYNGFSFKKSFPNLKNLDIRFSIFDPNFNFDILNNNYYNLYIDHCKNYYNTNFNNLKKIKTLSICGNDNIINIENFHGTKLILDSCYNFKMFNFQNLVDLSLRYNPLIEGKHTLLLKNINNLDLSFTNIDFLSDSINNLKQFIGESCNNLIEFPKYQYLVFVNLSSCKNIKHILTKKIKTLNIRFSESLILNSDIVVNSYLI